MPLKEPMPEKISVFDGDITTLDLDAIVNAANRHLAPGAGVCGAIHRAAGPELARACAQIPGGCLTGEAKLTPGFKLKARHVIHTVGPVWQGGEKGEDGQLACCYRNSLALAAENGIRSIAFPAISTGVYGYPLDEAAPVALETVRRAKTRVEEVRFVLFDQVAYDAFTASLTAEH